MFGFLKQKLKDAVAKFTKGAEENVKEERVEDERQVEQAKREERALLKQREQKVTEIPELPEQREHNARRAKPETAAPVQAAASAAPPKTSSPSVERQPVAEKRPEPAKPEKPKPAETPVAKPQPAPKPVEKPVPKPLEKPRPQTPAPQPVVTAKLPKPSVKPSEVAITYFVHGTTTDNEQRRSSGWNDVALSTLGEQQSKELASKLVHDFDVIYVSDLSRAVRSAELTWPGRGLVKDGRLREADYGDLNGHPERELEEYAQDHDLLLEGYPGGETLLDVERRMRSLLNDLYKTHRGKHVAIVAHKAPQLALDVLLNGKTWVQAIADDWRKKKAWRPGWAYTIAAPIPEPKAATPAPEPKQDAKPEPAPKKGFLKSLFSKAEPKAELKPEPKPDSKPAKAAPKLAGEPGRERPVPVEEKTAPEPPVPVAEGIEGVEPVLETEPAVETPVPVKPATRPEPAPAPDEAPKGFFAKLKETFTKKTLSDEKFEELFWELEVTLLENNVALEVIEKIKADLKGTLTAGKVSRLGVEDLVLLSLKESVDEILSIDGFDLVQRIKASKKRPYVIAFIGVNGSGKTTTLAKVANLFQTEELSVVMAASDTFRAAAIDQLKEHADKLGVKLIAQGYGADPAAVAYDAVQHATAKGIDVVMIDTAGRLHSNTNLMAELQKVVRVAQPDLKIFIGESITGNDCVEQAKEFDRLVGIDAIILSKADVDEKGGAALSVSYVTKKPILYLGVGQSYGDLKEFDKEEIIKGLGL